eukprot:COSAG02_NODE_127_length_34879_cov_12.705060_19_plen_51_part_00
MLFIARIDTGNEAHNTLLLLLLTEGGRHTHTRTHWRRRRRPLQAGGECWL